MRGVLLLLHVVQCKMAALRQEKVRQRLVTLGRALEGERKKNERELQSIEELEWKECEKSNQV